MGDTFDQLDREPMGGPIRRAAKPKKAKRPRRKTPARRVETVEGWVVVGPDCALAWTFDTSRLGARGRIASTKEALARYGYRMSPATLTIHHQEGGE